MVEANTTRKLNKRTHISTCIGDLTKAHRSGTSEQGNVVCMYSLGHSVGRPSSVAIWSLWGIMKFYYSGVNDTLKNRAIYPLPDGQWQLGSASRSWQFSRQQRSRCLARVSSIETTDWYQRHVQCGCRKTYTIEG